MPRLQEFLERAAGQVASPFWGLATSFTTHYRADGRDSETASETAASQAGSSDNTPAESDEPEAQGERQRISAFMPLSRWMARVQAPGEGQSKS